MPEEAMSSDGSCKETSVRFLTGLQESIWRKSGMKLG